MANEEDGARLESLHRERERLESLQRERERLESREDGEGRHLVLRRMPLQFTWNTVAD